MTALSAPRALAPWRSRAMRAAVAAWGGIASVAFAASLPASSRAAATVCGSADCPAGSVDAVTAANLARSGISLEVWSLVGTALDAVFAVTCFVAGALVLRSRREAAVATAAVLFALGLAFPQTLDAAAAVQPALSPAVTLLTTVALAALLCWFLTFPDGRLRARSSVPILGAAIAYVVAVPALAALGVAWFVIAPLGLVVLGSIAVDVVLRFARRTRRTPSSGAGGVLLTAAVALIALGAAGVLQGTVIERGTIADVILQLALTGAFLALPVAIGVSMLRRGLWDGRGSLLRTLAAGITVTVALSAFVTVYVVAADAGADPTMVAVATTAALAVATVPLFAGVRDVLVRLTRGAIEPGRAVGDLSARLPHATARDETARAAERVVVDVLGVEDAWVESAQDASREIPADAQRFVIAHGDLSAHLVVVPRPLQDLSSPREQAALRGVAAYLGAALAAAQRQEALQALHAELVVARDDERRALRDELHDDLGPVLSSVVLRLRAAERSIADDGARSLVEASRHDVTGAVDAVRRIAYGLRPPGLEEHGLAEALEVFARSLPGFEVSVHDETAGTAVPSGIQVAAYRIAVEAIANAVRHSGGSRCALVLRVEDGMLTVEAEDDGSGRIDRAGVGILSMRRRVAELDGTLEEGMGATGGVRLIARLPLEKEVAAP